MYCVDTQEEDLLLAQEEDLLVSSEEIFYFKITHLRVHTTHLWCPNTSMVSTQQMCSVDKRRKSLILGTNGVAVPRHGLILNHNEATGSRKVSRYLPGLREAI